MIKKILCVLIVIISIMFLLSSVFVGEEGTSQTKIGEKIGESKLVVPKVPKVVENYIVEEFEVEITINTSEVELLAKTVYGEGGGLNRFEQSAIVWCILNRVDAGMGTITEVVTAPGQFDGYNYNNPVTDDIRSLVEDVLIRWKMEKLCIGDVGRTLPPEFLWFYGDGAHNHYRSAYTGPYVTWDWSLPNVYA